MQPSTSRESIDRLIAGREYATAASLLAEICRNQPRNVRMRQQLAEVLRLAGESHKAVRVLEELVDDFARAGMFAKAIALIKTMERIEPGRKELEFKLAVLVKKQEEGTRTVTKPAVKRRTKPPAPAKTKPPAKEKVLHRSSDFDDIILQGMVEEGDILHMVEATPGVSALQGSALFHGFNAKELEALFSSLQLITFKPGEIVVAEGQSGASLFLIASGSVRVYVRHPSGSQKQIRVMRQGDFFGEISLLKGTRRTATITAANRCELLELDRSAVNSIAAMHPKVWEIIEEFCRRRAGSVEELGARGQA